MTKDKWIGTCKLCINPDKKLATIILTGDCYSISLKRMCEDCRKEVLTSFYESLARKNKTFLGLSQKIYSTKE